MAKNVPEGSDRVVELLGDIKSRLQEVSEKASDLEKSQNALTVELKSLASTTDRLNSQASEAKQDQGDVRREIRELAVSLNTSKQDAIKVERELQKSVSKLGDDVHTYRSEVTRADGRSDMFQKIAIGFISVNFLALAIAAWFNQGLHNSVGQHTEKLNGAEKKLSDLEPRITKVVKSSEDQGRQIEAAEKKLDLTTRNLDKVSRDLRTSADEIAKTSDHVKKISETAKGLETTTTALTMDLRQLGDLKKLAETVTALLNKVEKNSSDIDKFASDMKEINSLMRASLASTGGEVITLRVRLSKANQAADEGALTFAIETERAVGAAKIRQVHARIERFVAIKDTGPIPDFGPVFCRVKVDGSVKLLITLVYDPKVSDSMKQFFANGNGVDVEATFVLLP